MKINLFLAAGLICLLLGAALPANRTIVPPGTVKIVDNFYVDQTEVSNISWREYQSWLQQNHGQESDSYKSARLDTTIWQNGMKSMAGTYGQHPAFDNYPVVGVSHQQAQAYCRWRSQVVKEMLAANYSPHQWAHLRNLEYRLPTMTEWELIARLNRDQAGRPGKKEKYPGKALFNLRRTPAGAPDYDPNSVAGALNDHALTVAPVKAFLPGELDIYNLYGNVAEMVAEPGKAVGGSWRHTEREALHTPFFDYEGPADWLGFRCICSLPPIE